MKFLKHGTFLFLFLSLIHSANALSTGQHAEHGSSQSVFYSSSGKLKTTPESTDSAATPSHTANNITQKENSNESNFSQDLPTSCRSVTNFFFSTGSAFCTWAKNAFSLEESQPYQIVSTVSFISQTLVPIDMSFGKEFIKKNRDWFMHLLADGATIGAIIKGSFANRSASLFEYIVSGPRWLFGFSSLAENLENMEEDMKRKGPNSQKIQTLRSWFHKIMFVHLASDLADASIRGARDYVGLETSDGLKSMVTNVTLVTQAVDLILLAYATHLEKLDRPYGKKKK